MKRVQREWKTRNQHAVLGMWKAYFGDLRKRLGRAPKPELVEAHRRTFHDGLAAGVAMIIKGFMLSRSQEVLAQWASDISLELKETYEENKWV
jgi:hypothetical protein